MVSSLRLTASAAAVLATALLVAGCATSPGASTPDSSTPGSSTPNTSTAPTPDDSGSSTAPAIGDDIEAAWLDDGRMFAIVTWGSSTCVPVVDEVTANGQTITVSLVDAPSADGEEKFCTADLSPRASIGIVPEGIDPTQDVEFIVTAGEVTDDVDLDGNSALTAVPGSPTEYAPSASWFDDEGVVLLTWGSSTCPPIVENLEEQPGGATLTLKDQAGNCSKDMAPRATTLLFSDDDDDDDDGFILTLVGDNLDAAVAVMEG